MRRVTSGPPMHAQGQRRDEAVAGRQMESLASNANFPALPQPATGRRPSNASLAPGSHRPSAGIALLSHTAGSLRRYLQNDMCWN